MKVIWKGGKYNCYRARVAWIEITCSWWESSYKVSTNIGQLEDKFESLDSAAIGAEKYILKKVQELNDALAQ
jgi:hypothetical protein